MARPVVGGGVPPPPPGRGQEKPCLYGQSGTSLPVQPVRQAPALGCALVFSQGLNYIVCFMSQTVPLGKLREEQPLPLLGHLEGFGGRAPGEGIYARWLKRPLDMLSAAASLVALSPVLLACALLVRLTSPGPGFLCQIRVGRGGRPFKVLKFRTLFVGAEGPSPGVVVRGDKRVTAVGGFLRRAKLDELPQLVNVLRGEMSLVGPRPRVPEEFDLERPEERALLALRPGITSYASLCHRMESDFCSDQEDPGATYRESLVPQKTYLDGEYRKNIGLALDLKLILLTLALVFIPGTARPRVVRFLGLEIHTHSELAQMTLDAAIFAAAVWLAYWLRYEQDMPPLYRWQRTTFLFLLPALRVAVNHRFGIYRMIWRYVNLVDAATLAISLATVSAVLLFARVFLPSEIDSVNFFQLPVTVIAMEFLLSMGGCLGMRGTRRLLYEVGHRYQPLPSAEKRRILIVGAGFSGLGMALEMTRQPHLEVLGFVDDDPAKLGRQIAGHAVLGPCSLAGELVRRYRISDVVVSVQSLGDERMRALSEDCRSSGVQLHRIPPIDQLLKPAGEGRT